MHVSLFDDPALHLQLFPITFTRPIGEIRCGILTIKEKWKSYFPSLDGYLTKNYLSAKYPKPKSSVDLLINSSLIPSDAIINLIDNLKNGESLYVNNKLAAYRPENRQNFETIPTKKIFSEIDSASFIEYPFHIISLLGQEIKADFVRLTLGRVSETIDDPYSIVYGNQLFIEKGVKIKAATFNTETGPIYLDTNSEVQEGAVIRGPFALGKHSVVNMSAKIKGDTSIGPYCKVGGEVSVSVIQGYSNKGHDGFLGHSYLGEWCNLGADTNNSNLKNTYATVRFWDYLSESYQDSGMQFLGMIMGDHSKTGINTMINTGTSIGVSSNIFGAGYPSTYLPSFSWGGMNCQDIYSFAKAIETCKRVFERRSVEFTLADELILKAIFEFTQNKHPLN